MSQNSRQSTLARWQTTLICLVLGVVTLAVYWAARRNEFLNWDDLTYVSINDHVRGGITWANIVWAFTHSYSSNWHPLTWISHMLDCQLFGLNPSPPHLVNVAFHIANVLLLFVFLRNATGALWRSAFVAALFALHPLHVESVAWLAERKDVLSTFFFLLTLVAYAAYVGTTGPRTTGPRTTGPRTTGPQDHGPQDHGPQDHRQRSNAQRFYALSLVAFALGLMSKPMLVTLPFVLLLLDYWPLHQLQLPLKERKVGTPTGGWDSRSYLTIKELLVEKIPFFALSLASCVVTFIAQKSGGAVAAFESLPFGARLENALVSYAAYLVKFIWPAALSPIYPHPTHWDTWRVVGSALLLLVLSAAAWLTRRRFPFVLVGWLWYLGTLVPVIGLIQVGSQAFADRYTYIPLIGIMFALVWLLPSSSFPSSLTSRALTAGSAVLVLLLLTFRTTQQVRIWQNTGTLFRHALDLAPNNVQALYGLGTYLVEQGQVEQGKELLERAISLHEKYPEALGSMADLLDSQGKYADAVHFYEAALDAQPENTSALNNLAWLKATCSDPAIRNGAEAVRLAERACQLTGYSKPIFIGTLAAAQAETGDFTAAIATAERAVAVATALHLEDTAAKNRDLISLYRQGKTATGGQPGTKR
jgi:Tfp pilus assembly protein PilF